MDAAVKKYGNAYAQIAKEYFGHCQPTVTRQNVANYINRSPHLKKISSESM